MLLGCFIQAMGNKQAKYVHFPSDPYPPFRDSPFHCRLRINKQTEAVPVFYTFHCRDSFRWIAIIGILARFLYIFFLFYFVVVAVCVAAADVSITLNICGHDSRIFSLIRVEHAASKTIRDALADSNDFWESVQTELHPFFYLGKMRNFWAFFSSSFSCC